MRREILKLSAGWVLCAAAWAACGGENTVTRKELGFQISFPDGFEVFNSSGADFAVTGVNRVTFTCAELLVTDLKECDSLRSFFTIPVFRALLKATNLTAIDVVRLNGRSAIKLSMICDKCRILIYYTVANARGYAIYIGASETDSDKYVKEFDAIVASFKIIEAK